MVIVERFPNARREKGCSVRFLPHALFHLRPLELTNKLRIVCPAMSAGHCSYNLDGFFLAVIAHWKSVLPGFGSVRRIGVFDSAYGLCRNFVIESHSFNCGFFCVPKFCPSSSIGIEQPFRHQAVVVQSSHLSYK
jgi:hypothetical protein